jgi:hypothetical protein
MDSVGEIRAYLDQAIAAGGAIDDLARQWAARYPSDLPAFRRRAVKAWIAQGTKYRDIRHWGKFRRALILGAAIWGDPFIVEFEQAGLLLPRDAPHQEFSACLRDLARQIANGDALSRLRDRVETYRSYVEFAAFVDAHDRHARRLLNERPFRFGRTLVAFTGLHFLRALFDFEVGAEYANVFAEHGSPERLAEAASIIIALANEHLPLQSHDFTFPLSGIDVSADFIFLLRYGAALVAVRETGKMISIMNYELARVRGSRLRVYRLQGARPDVEYTLRLGFVRGEIGKIASRLYVSHESASMISMVAAAEDLLSRFPQLVELRDSDTPARRLRLHIPLAPQLFEVLSHVRFYEEAVQDDGLSQELELPINMPDAASWEIVPGFTLEAFRKVCRTLQFLSVLDAVAMRRYESDPLVVYNSLTRAVTLTDFVELLKVAGIDAEQASTFLDLLAADVRRLAFYDMQYRPFLSIAPSTFQVGNAAESTPLEVVYSSGVVMTANVTVNVQRAHSIRIKANATAFVALAAEALRSVFENVRTGVALKLGDDATDVDIMVLSQRTLYLIECKHSITPTGAHELRDLWSDINHGVHQLMVAMKILDTEMPSYLAGLYPGTKKAQCASLRIQPVVLCSHRVFSGLSLAGIPIRDQASLARVCGDGIVSMGSEDDSGHLVMRRYRLRPNEKATADDFDDYLSDSSRFFEMFRPFMHEYDHLDRLLGGSLVLARNTFVCNIAQDAWSEHLEQMGAVSVNSERHAVERLGPTPLGGDVR